MNRKQVMDYLMMRDGRNPYGSRGGYVGDKARGNYDRANRNDMRDRNYDMANRYDSRQYDSRRDYGSYSQQDNARYDRGYQQYDQYYRGDNARNMNDMYYDAERNRQVFPYDQEQDEARRYDRAYHNVRGLDYADMNQGYGDYGETLGRQELEKWDKKLMKNLDEKDKQFFQEHMVSQKAKQMGIQMQGFNEKELFTTALMLYSDYGKVLKPFVGSNMEIYLHLAKAFLTDADASVKGGEKLAVYHDCIVQEKEDD